MCLSSLQGCYSWREMVDGGVTPGCRSVGVLEAAKSLLDEHGDQAGMIATIEVLGCLERGDEPGARLWRNILAAVGELRRGGSPIRH